MTTTFKKYIKEAGIPDPTAGMAAAPIDPNAQMAPPPAGLPAAPPAGLPAAPPAAPPQSAQQDTKNTQVNGEELINALDLMDPERIKKYLKNIQSNVMEIPSEIDSMESSLDASNPETSDEGIEIGIDKNKILSSADILKRYLILRKISSAAADVIKLLNSDRIQQAQIEQQDKDMPDLNAGETPQQSNIP